MTLKSNERGVSEHLPPVGGEVEDAEVMRLWRECGLPEYFLGNGGTNHKLVAFAKACAAREVDAVRNRLDAFLEQEGKAAIRSLPPSGGWRNAVLEEAAKVADAEVDDWHEKSGNPAKRIAGAIRSLKQPLPEPPTPPGEGET